MANVPRERGGPRRFRLMHRPNRQEKKVVRYSCTSGIYDKNNSLLSFCLSVPLLLSFFSEFESSITKNPRFLSFRAWSDRRGVDVRLLRELLGFPFRKPAFVVWNTASLHRRLPGSLQWVIVRETEVWTEKNVCFIGLLLEEVARNIERTARYFDILT